MAAQVPASSGLEEIYQGQADNMLLAFMRYTDPNRELSASEYGFLEEFVQGSGSAWTISTPLTLREGHFKTRPHHAFRVSVRNGRPHRVFIDGVEMGTRALFEIDGILSVDQVSAIRLHYDETTPKTFDLSIGDDTEAQSPLARVMNTAQTFMAGVAMLFGSSELF